MMAAENPSSSANKLAKVTEAFKSFKIAVDENLDKLEKAFLVEVDRTCDSVNVLVNKVKDVKDEKLGATVKDEFKNVDVNYPDEILNQAWAVIRNNIAWLVSGGCEISHTITPVPYITDSKFYRPSMVLLKSGRDYTPKLTPLLNIFTDDPEERRVWQTVQCLAQCATADTRSFTGSEVQHTPISPGFTYEHWNDPRNETRKMVRVTAPEANLLTVRHPEIEKVKLNKKIKGLNEKDLSRIYLIQDVVVVRNLEMKVIITNPATGDEIIKECTLTTRDPGMMPEGVPLAFFCDKFKVKDGTVGKQIENDPNSCRNGIFQRN